MTLWMRVTEDTELDPAGYFILAEACRTADIIEQLSGALASRHTQWIGLSDEIVQVVQQAGVEVGEINLVVNPILGEIRQQRLTMRQLLAQLKLGKVADGTAADDDPIARIMAEFNMPD